MSEPLATRIKARLFREAEGNVYLDVAFVNFVIDEEAAFEAEAAALDMDRLARALHAHGDCQLCNDEAGRVAAEYERLSR